MHIEMIGDRSDDLVAVIRLVHVQRDKGGCPRLESDMSTTNTRVAHQLVNRPGKAPEYSENAPT